jgi:hypothetical protein
MECKLVAINLIQRHVGHLGNIHVRVHKHAFGLIGIDTIARGI